MGWRPAGCRLLPTRSIRNREHTTLRGKINSLYHPAARKLPAMGTGQGPGCRGRRGPVCSGSKRGTESWAALPEATDVPRAEFCGGADVPPCCHATPAVGLGRWVPQVVRGAIIWGRGSSQGGKGQGPSPLARSQGGRGQQGEDACLGREGKDPSSGRVCFLRPDLTPRGGDYALCCTRQRCIRWVLTCCMISRGYVLLSPKRLPNFHSVWALMCVEC